MFVGTLIAAGVGEDGRLRDPTWEDIASVIQSLDRNTLMLEARGIEDCNMIIDAGSGDDGLFVVQAWMPDGLFYYLTDPKRGGGETSRVAGEQLIPWPSQWVQDRQSVLQVAETFARRGELDSRFQWQVGG